MASKAEIEFTIIEQEILEVLYDLQNEFKRKNIDGRIKRKQILELLDIEMSKSQLTNIIQRKFLPDYVDYIPYDGLFLTIKGYKEAKHAIRNHRLAEALVGNILGIAWPDIHDNACEIEHGMTPVIAQSIRNHLTIPITPFGLPIPSDTDIFDEMQDEKLFSLDYTNENIPLNTLLRVKQIKRPHNRETINFLISLGIKSLDTEITINAIDQQKKVFIVRIFNSSPKELPFSNARRLVLKKVE